MTDSPMRFGTKVVHAGQHPEPVTGAIMPPIFQTSTYVQPELGQEHGVRICPGAESDPGGLGTNGGRVGEAGPTGIAFASGLSAIETVVKRLSAGDHVVTEENTYGGTTRMFNHVLSRLGIEFTFVDSRDPANVAEAMRPNDPARPRGIPLQPAHAALRYRSRGEGRSRRRRHSSVWITPSRHPSISGPLELGADVVMHSTTKYLNGHSDVLGGMPWWWQTRPWPKNSCSFGSPPDPFLDRWTAGSA